MSYMPARVIHPSFGFCGLVEKTRDVRLEDVTLISKCVFDVAVVVAIVSSRFCVRISEGK